MMNVEMAQPQARAIERAVQLRRDLIFHVVLLAVAIAVLAMSFVMRSVGEELVYLPGSYIPLPPSCASRQLFGIDCPGCGLTRSFIAISSGQWQRAWHFNPGSFFVYLFVLGQIPWRGYQIWRILTNRFPVFSIWLFVPLGIAAGCLLLQWILKLIGI